MTRAAPAAGAGVAAAVLLATLAARHADPSVVSPVTPAGGWNDVWIASLVAGLCLAAGGWVLALRFGCSLRLAVAIAVVVQALPLAGPVLLSKDLYLYWDHARIVNVHDANPYVAVPNDFPNDAAYPYTSEIWRPDPAPYGPAWETLARVPAAVAGTSVDAAEIAFRVLAVLGVVAVVLIVARRTRSAAAVALVGWSPLLALHYAGGAHGDAWMTAFLVLGVAAGLSATSGAAWAVAGAFKPIPVILLPLELARTRLRMSRRWWISVVAVALAIAIAATAEFGLHWFKGAARGVHQPSPIGGVHWLTELGVRHRYAVLAGALVFVAVYLVLLREAWLRGRARLSLAATTLCLTSSLLGPWYALWPLGLAAIELDVTAGAAALALSAYLLLADAVAF